MRFADVSVADYIEKASFYPLAIRRLPAGLWVMQAGLQ
jgi:hypothetical protein